MIRNVSLTKNSWGDFDIVVELDRSDVEFAPDFWASAHLPRVTDRFLRRLIGRVSKEARIRSIRFVVSGVMVGSIAFSSYLALYASAQELLSLGYLYSGTAAQQISYVQRTGGAIDTASPGYFDINVDGSLNLDNLKTQVIAALQSDGVRVTPFLSNHWDRQKGKAALQNMEALTDQIAEAVALYNLDGVQVDIENLTEAQRSDYVAFVALLRQKLGWGKELSVAVAANPKGSSTGWAGSYNYAALAQYADYLVIMAYDEHYEGGEAARSPALDCGKRHPIRPGAKPPR
jgi:spore germination protein YaaH